MPPIFQSMAVTILAGLALISVAQAAQQPFDFFLLSREWDVGYCDNNKCSGPPARPIFTLHGLWPSWTHPHGRRPQDRGPQNCDGEPPHPPFDPSQLQPLLPLLRKWWPSLVQGDRVFWDHEWTKHGTCAKAQIGGELEYFNTTLALHRAYNLGAFLQQADIQTTSGGEASLSDVLEAFDTGTGVPGSNYLQCTRHELVEVHTCLDLQLQPIECPVGGNERECTPLYFDAGDAEGASRHTSSE